MKHCVHGLGYMVECGDEAFTTREGWPLCIRHALVWDGFEAMAASLPEDSEPDLVQFARDNR